MFTLLLASSQDPVSMNFYHAVLNNTNRNKGIKMAHGIVHDNNLGLAHLLMISDKNHIFTDNIDLNHEKCNNVQADEFLVLSK